MLRISKYIIIVAMATIFISCEQELDNSMLWGRTDYYTDFLFRDYKPVKMIRTICFENNDDAYGYVGDIKLGLYKMTEDNSYIPVGNEIKLYKNDNLCEKNYLLIAPTDKEVKLGIEFTPEAEEGVHKWFLKVLDNGGYDRINEYETSEDAFPLLLEWNAEKNDIINPLKLGLNICLITIIIALLMWLFIMKPILYPTFKIGNIQLVSESYFSVKHIYGARKLVMTNSTKKQNALNRLFTGKIIYEKNELWTDEWELYPKGKEARLVTKRNYAVTPFTMSLNRHTEYEIEHLNSGIKTKITLL